MFTFQATDAKNNVKIFETDNYTEGCIIIGAIKDLKYIRVWEGSKLIREERR